MQWSNSSLTNANPLGPKYPSIVFMNSSAQGYPELGYFFRYKFLPSMINSSIGEYGDYENISFPVEWALSLLKHNANISDWVRDWDTLLHIGNLEYIFAAGEKYRENRDLAAFGGMRTRFKCGSLEQARVLFEYLDYLATDFTVLSDLKGSTEILGIAALST